REHREHVLLRRTWPGTRPEQVLLRPVILPAWLERLRVVPVLHVDVLLGGGRILARCARSRGFECRQGPRKLRQTLDPRRPAPADGGPGRLGKQPGERQRG